MSSRSSSPPRRLAREDRRHRRGGRLVGQALAIDAEVLAYPLNVVAISSKGMRSIQSMRSAPPVFRGSPCAAIHCATRPLPAL